MPSYLLIESRAPGSAAADRFVGDACRLRHGGARVVLALIQDGVLAAVPGVLPRLAEFTGAGGAVWAEDWSIAQRGVARSDLAAGVIAVGMDRIAETLLRQEVRAVWH
ncbi:hypothetical protein ACTD5D_16975 [Nocardia takedensis]|uniref:hypothetical protein n=1 Tax=Nocardia takedensis TaxID=259390 RepID=UPI00031F9001|nr:hypothetical protein [Nocardia takedensis]